MPRLLETLRCSCIFLLSKTYNKYLIFSDGYKRWGSVFKVNNNK